MRRGAHLRASQQFDLSHPFFSWYFSAGLREVGESERVEDYMRETNREHRAGDILRGPMSGMILLHVLSSASAGKTGASANGAFSAISKTCNNQVRGASLTELKATWKTYSPVAHFWATDLLWEPLQKLTWLEVWSSQERAIVWLAHAEELRRQGEEYKPPRSKSTLLDPGQTWSLPDTVSLPSARPDIPSPEAIMKALSASLSKPR